jgi:hypothetical protein
VVRPPNPRGLIVVCLADFHHAPRGAHDSTRTTCSLGVHDSALTSCGFSIPTLLASPSGYTGATGIASPSAVAAGKGHTGGTSGQPSSNDHTGEAGLSAVGWQTHIVATSSSPLSPVPTSICAALTDSS